MIRDVIDHTAPFWAGEYSVTHRYFTDHPRTAQSDLRWVRFQMVKEWAGGGVYGKDVTVHTLIQQVAKAMEGIENDGVVENAEELSHLLHFAAEEFQHYARLCDAHRLLAPDGRMSMADMNALADGDRLKAVRNAVREEPLGDLVVELSEGGGLALFFAIVDAFAETGVRSEFDALLVDFAQGTLDDEKKHLRHRFQAIQDADLSEADWYRVDVGLQKISAEKLLERNRQFGGVFPEPELAEMGRDLEAGRAFTSAHLEFVGDLLGAVQS